MVKIVIATTRLGGSKVSDEESKALLLALALEPKPFRYSKEPDPFGWAAEEPSPVYVL